MVEFIVQAFDLPTSAGFFFCCGFSTSTFYRVYRIRKGDQLLIHESEHIFGSAPRYKECKLSERRLCKNNVDEKFEVRFYNYSNTGHHTDIGKTTLSVNNLLDAKTFPILNSSNRTRGTVKFMGVKRYIKSSFTDYIAAGLQLMLIIAIDFTASNGSPKSPSSLHFISSTKRSTYEIALEEVSNILLDYDYDKQVPVYGFGAKCTMPTFNSYGQIHHCFPLNGDENNAHVYMVEGIMKAYRDVLKFLEFGGPTYFKVILENAIQECREIQKQINQYAILFILTDGDIHDRETVIDQIIECCTLPISIIIVGVGNGPFDIMHEIDDDDCIMQDSKGRKNIRDLVQFVEFRNFKNNGVELAREVLDELPRQVEEYYQLMGIGPEKIKALGPAPLPPPPPVKKSEKRPNAPILEPLPPLERFPLNNPYLQQDQKCRKS
jgi:hypothetical protein